MVFTNDQTRFTIVLLGVTAKDLKVLEYRFEDMLGNCMFKLCYDHETFDTQCDRSAQGTLRLMTGNLEAHTWGCTDIMELAQYALSARLCDRPCRVKGMKEMECLLPRKEMLTLLERHS